MRSLAWLALGASALACSGSAFTAAEPSAGGSANGGEDNTAGVLNRAGRGSGGRPTVGGSESGGTTAVTPPASVCPEKRPESGQACEGSLSCSYGEDVRTQCRARASCSDGVWKLSEPDCPELAECGALVRTGVVCEAQAAPCATSEFQYCECSACEGDVCAAKSTWHCSGGSSSGGCSRLAPNQGQSCSGDASCSYGACGLGSGGPQALQVTCQGTWTWQPSDCAQ